MPQVKKKPVDEAKTNPEKPEQKAREEAAGSSVDQGKKGTIDYSTSKVGIGQILADFKNTVVAIGAPKEIEEEVMGYLNLVDTQSKKPKPSPAIIKSNLKNAAYILDDYITKTLNKESKVVFNWVDALLLQEVDYKASSKEVLRQEPVEAENIKRFNESVKQQAVENEPANKTDIKKQAVQAETKQESVAAQQDFAPNVTAAPVQPQKAKLAPVQGQRPTDVRQHQSITQQPATKTTNPIRQDHNKLESIRLKKLYRDAEKLTDAGNFDAALESYEKTLKYAQKIGDTKTQTSIYMDVAYIHDVNNDLPKALDNYNNALELSRQNGDIETQAQAHYNMATIYDDVGQIDVAMQHYYNALAFDGETENLKGQALTLNSLGNMHSLKNEHKAALDYYKLSFGLAKEQKDLVGQASVMSNVAGIFRDLGYDKRALNYYKSSIKYDIEAGNVPGYAKSYDLAGDIMFKNGSYEKAQTLYKKSMTAGQKIGDRSWASRMLDKVKTASAD